MRNNRAIAAAITFGAIAMLTAWADVSLAADKKSGGSRFGDILGGLGTLAGGLMPIGYEEEQSLGQAISLQVVARFGGTLEKPELVRYVNLVGQAVALTSDRPDIPYHFAVLKDDSINAFAAPAGYVFVTNGLLKQVHNEAELAAVLGHEIAHVSQKHILEVIQRSKRLAGVSEAGLAYAHQNPDVFKNLIDAAAKKVLDEGLDQEKELEGDSLGEVFAARVGYDPTAYVVLLNRLRVMKGDDKAFFKTHPNFSNRINAVQQVIQTIGWKPTGVLLDNSFARLLGKI